MTKMRNISISDVTLKKTDETGNGLPFRVKIELAKLLSGMGVSVIETSPVKDGKTDYFLVKSLASTITGSTVAVPVDVADPNSPANTWDALKEAAKPRLQVQVPVSTVQMEYFSHKKPEAMIQLIRSSVSACSALCPEVEFIAQDFTRSDRDFLMQAISTAIEAGASIVTVNNVAGNILPNEYHGLIREIREALPDSVRLGVYCSNDLFLADSCAIVSVVAGADEIKTISLGNSTVSLEHFPKILNTKSDVLRASCDVNLTQLNHTLEQVKTLCALTNNKSTATAVVSGDAEMKLPVNADREAVVAAAASLGYELGEEDAASVFEAFQRLSSANGTISLKEIDAIVASVAFQVPPTYTLDSFVVNTGNLMTPTCHVRLRKGEELMECVCLGDGPVDAAFIAVETAIGKHYELDDFQVRAVTEGREALGETIVRLRHEGHVYSGRGISKDIIGSSVRAYLSALNKIVYEEGQA